MQITIDDRELKKYTNNLKLTSKYAYPLAARGTLNKLAYISSSIAKKKILPKVFTLRNSFIKKTVVYERSANTFKINAMYSSVGQASRFNSISSGRNIKTNQLEKQEFGGTFKSSSKHTITPMKGARISSNMNKQVRGTNRFNRNKSSKGSDILRKIAKKGTRTSNSAKELQQITAIARHRKLNLGLVFHHDRNSKKGAFLIKARGGKRKIASKKYAVSDKYKHIRKHEWLNKTTDIAIKQRNNIFKVEAERLIYNQLKKGLKNVGR